MNARAQCLCTADSMRGMVAPRKGRKSGTRHGHDATCEIIPVEDRETRFLGWSPVMYPRMTYQEALTMYAAGLVPVDHGPVLRILRQPVARRNLTYVVTWEEWNEEAEKEHRGYDAEIQHHPTRGDFAHVRSKPGSWSRRRVEFRRWLRESARRGQRRVTYRRRRRVRRP